MVFREISYSIKGLFRPYFTYAYAIVLSSHVTLPVRSDQGISCLHVQFLTLTETKQRQFEGRVSRNEPAWL